MAAAEPGKMDVNHFNLDYIVLGLWVEVRVKGPYFFSFLNAMGDVNSFSHKYLLRGV